VTPNKICTRVDHLGRDLDLVFCHLDRAHQVFVLPRELMLAGLA
jgi:hypothetical protein